MGIARREFVKNAGGLAALVLVIAGCADRSHHGITAGGNTSQLYNVRDALNHIVANFQDTRIIVGDAAPSEDVSGAIDVAVGLSQYSGKALPVGNAKLDTDVIANPYETNVITIGDPARNMVTNLLVDGLSQADGAVPQQLGESVLRAYGLPNGKIAVEISAKDGDDIRRACKVVGNYASYDVNGRIVHVQGTTLSNMSTIIVKP